MIDSGSPYITIYSKSQETFETFWHNVDGSVSGFNCNYTSRYCSNTANVMTYMTIYMGQSGDYTYNVTIFQEDILDGSYVKFFYDGDQILLMVLTRLCFIFRRTFFETLLLH